MITNEDFENVEEAMLVIEGWGNQDRDMRLIEAEDVVYEFVRKILYEARRDFLTDKKVVISKMETVQTIPKITPMK